MPPDASPGLSVADRTDAGERYRYDASGNIVEKTVNGQTVTMTYDAANQLMTRTDATGTTRFVYDSAGRLVEEQRGGETLASYEYGYLDKVTSVTRDGVVTKFHYNARGMLVAKERDGKIIETLGWDGIGLIARDDTVFANEAHVSGGVPLVAATSDGSAANYFDSDYLGTTTASYSADGDVNAYVQGSFGQGTEFADARFTGKHYDADLGAHVFPFRNYRSDAGRWTSADPAGFPDGPNQHFYAPVPTMGLDPLGLMDMFVEYGVNYKTTVSESQDWEWTYTYSSGGGGSQSKTSKYSLGWGLLSAEFSEENIDYLQQNTTITGAWGDTSTINLPAIGTSPEAFQTNPYVPEGWEFDEWITKPLDTAMPVVDIGVWTVIDVGTFAFRTRSVLTDVSWGAHYTVKEL